MQSIKITIQHGHVYNDTTKERIVLEEGGSYLLVLESGSNIQVAQFEKPKVIRSEGSIQEDIRSISGVTHIKKIKSEGEHLYFFIGQPISNDRYKQSRFRIKLLESLYLYSCSDWKDEDLIKGGRLADCACVVDESKDEELPFFENVYAKSLSNVVKKTHIHFFGNQGSPSKNAFKNIYISPFKDDSQLLGTLRGFNEEDRVKK